VTYTEMIPCGCGATLRRHHDMQTGASIYVHGQHPLQLRIEVGDMIHQREPEKFREWLDQIHSDTEKSE
jgi:hypothetical protein